LLPLHVDKHLEHGKPFVTALVHQPTCTYGLTSTPSTRAYVLSHSVLFDGQLLTAVASSKTLPAASCQTLALAFKLTPGGSSSSFDLPPMERDLLLGLNDALSAVLVNENGASLTGAGMAVVAVEVKWTATPRRLLKACRQVRSNSRI
jgi:hypothetical protein